MKNVALITGASSGLGKEFAYIHAKNKGDMILVARRRDKLEALKQDLEAKFKVQVMLIIKDLSLTSAPEEIYNEIKKANITLEYLINNAGFGGLGKFHEREMQADMNMINVNIVALTALTRLFLPDFIQRNHGHILNVSSTASFMPGPLQAVYYATKAYVTFFSNAIAEEIKDTNVTVTSLMPGATNTEFASVSQMDKTSLFKKAASASKVAEDGYNGMLHGKLDVVSGVPFSQKLMIAMIPFVPKKMVLKQIHEMQKMN